MRSLAGVLAALAVLAACVVTAASVLEETAPAYPTCALACMLEYVPNSGCLNGTAEEQILCLCTNNVLQADVTKCVRPSCTAYEALMTKNATYTMCGVEVRDKSLTPLLIGVIGGGIAFIAYILRMCASLPEGGRDLGWDDWTITICVALATPPTIFAVLLSKNGLGKDMWTLPLQNIEKVLFYYYLGELFYFAALSMNKISILIFILRVFPDQKFRRIIYGVIGLCVGYAFGFIFATAFQCSPVNYSWLQIDSNAEGHCNSVNLQGWMSAIFNITIDLIIIILPLKYLYGLQVGVKKKLMIMFMFSLGIFVTIVSVIRLRSLIVFANSENITWDYNDAAYWSTIELHVGIICACLPSLRALFVLLGLRVLGITNENSRATGYSTGKSGKSSTMSSRVQPENRAQSVPKHGDEGDFIPLVDVYDRKLSSTQYGVAASAPCSYESKHSRTSD